MSESKVTQHARFFSQSTDYSKEQQKQNSDPTPYGLQFAEKMFDAGQSDDMSLTHAQSPTQVPQGGDTCIDVDADF